MEEALKREMKLRRGAADELKSLRADDEDAERSTLLTGLVAEIMMDSWELLLKSDSVRMEEVSRLIYFRSA